MSFQRSLVYCSAVLSMFLAACGGVSPDDGAPTNDATPTDADYEDIATGVAAIVVDADEGGDVASLNIAVDVSIGLPPPGSILGGEGKLDLGIGGVSYAWDVECKNASGMTNYCGPLTDSATVISSRSGKIDTFRFDATVDHSATWTVAKILSGTPVIDGQGKATMSSSFTTLLGNRSASFDFNYDARYQQIVIDPESNLPVQGTIEYSVEAKNTATGPNAKTGTTFMVDVKVSFDGTETATLQIDGKANFKLDLSTGKITAM